MGKCYIIKVKADLTIEKVEFNAQDSLAQLQEAVGGNVERVPVTMRHDLDLFVNEEGRIYQLKVNAILSMIYSVGAESVEIVRGDGVFAAHDGEGNTVGIEEDRADKIVPLLVDVRDAFQKVLAGREVRV